MGVKDHFFEQVKAAGSPDWIADRDSRIRSVVEIRGLPYACIGSATGGGLPGTAELVRLHSPEEWGGEITTYKKATKRRSGEFTYAGIKVRCRGKEYILGTEEITITEGEVVGMAAKRKRRSKVVKGKAPRLPGMQDSGIREIDLAAAEYLEVMTDRVELLNHEVKLKQQLLGLMHKHGKVRYCYEDLEVLLQPGEETIKVRRIRAKKEKKGDKAGAAVE